MLGEAVQISNRRALVLENEEKNTAPCQNYIHVQASTAIMNKNTGIRSAITNGTPVPPPQVRTTPLDRGGPAEQQKTDERLAAARSDYSGNHPCLGRRSSFSSGFGAGATAEGLSPTEDESQPFRPGGGDPGLLEELAISSVEKPSPAADASKRAGRSSPSPGLPKAWAPPSRYAAQPSSGRRT
jgi:hypothetical protein